MSSLPPLQYASLQSLRNPGPGWRVTSFGYTMKAIGSDVQIAQRIARSDSLGIEWTTNYEVDRDGRVTTTSDGRNDFGAK